MTTPEIPFNETQWNPFNASRAGWELVKDQYWLFVGMCFIGVLIGRAVPLGILHGTNDVWSVPDVFQEAPR